MYLLQSAAAAPACCIADMANLTINGRIPTAANVDASVLQVLDPALSVRHHWTHFVSRSQGGAGGGGAPVVDVDVRGAGGVVAVAMTTGADMATVNPLPGTGANAGGAPVGYYLVVLPTVAAANAEASPFQVACSVAVPDSLLNAHATATSAAVYRTPIRLLAQAYRAADSAPRRATLRLPAPTFATRRSIHHGRLHRARGGVRVEPLQAGVSTKARGASRCINVARRRATLTPPHAQLPPHPAQVDPGQPQ